ncbi:MAG TPA: 2-oxoglutarate and iron-dependent oxygenase domain-containing protein [Ilumatobacteraceae bacterium]
MSGAVPIIDISALRNGADTVALASVGAELDAACRDTGFFSIIGHGVDPQLMSRLDRAARQFFALDTARKDAIAMRRGGRAWRGWFALGEEVTSGIPDRKEGLYFGAELADDDPRVLAGQQMHGRNLFPADVPELRPAVLAWIDAMTSLGQLVMSAVAVGLGLAPNWFAEHMTAEPTPLFRIFRYPMPVEGDGAGEWGVAEHTDYGLLTLLMQDDCGGLQVLGRNGWVDVEPVAGAFVCNIGDMLERITAGRYRSTAHRVRNTSGRDRLSFPFFFDPSWDATIDPLPLSGTATPDESTNRRWDGRSVFAFTGTYGEYLTAKVGKVFPDLVPLL